MKIFDEEGEWLVTGGAGFIGSHLIDDLIEKNQKVVCLDNFSTGLKRNLRKSSRLQIIEEEVQNLNLKKFKNRFKGIFHLAAQASAPKSIDRMYESSSNNLLSSLKVLELANISKIPVIYASSSAVYGELFIGDDRLNKSSILSPYSMDKLCIEKYAKLFGKLYNTSSIGLRFFNVYGPRQVSSSAYSGVISIFLNNLMKDKEITVNGGNQTRDFIYVKDISKVLLKSMNFCDNKKVNEIFNVGTGNSISINELVVFLSKMLGVKPKIIKKTIPEGDPVHSNCITEKLNDILKINTEKFLSLDEGLEIFYKFLKKH